MKAYDSNGSFLFSQNIENSMQHNAQELKKKLTNYIMFLATLFLFVQNKIRQNLNEILFRGFVVFQIIVF